MGLQTGGIGRDELEELLEDKLAPLATKDDLASFEKAINFRLTSFEENVLKTVGKTNKLLSDRLDKLEDIAA